MTTAANNKRRGAAAERRVAESLLGDVYHGTAGDVLAAGHIVEVKSSLELRGYGRLRAHIEQAQRNATAQKKPWLLVLTGGRGFMNGEQFLLAPVKSWQQIVIPPGLTRLTTLTRQLGEAVDGLYIRTD